MKWGLVLSDDDENRYAEAHREWAGGFAAGLICGIVGTVVMFGLYWLAK